MNVIDLSVWVAVGGRGCGGRGKDAAVRTVAAEQPQAVGEGEG